MVSPKRAPARSFRNGVARQIDAAPPVWISCADALRDKEDRARVDLVCETTNRRHRGEPTSAVYNDLYVNELFLRMAPCCYLTNTPGHDEIRLSDVGNIVDPWNAPSIRTLHGRAAADAAAELDRSC